MDDDSVRRALPRKLAARDVEVEFQRAWDTVADYVTRLAEGLPQDQRDEGPNRHHE